MTLYKSCIPNRLAQTRSERVFRKDGNVQRGKMESHVLGWGFVVFTVLAQTAHHAPWTRTDIRIPDLPSLQNVTIGRTSPTRLRVSMI